MTFCKQLVAFAGISFFSSAMLPAGEALAFGQQWRPAPGFGPAQMGSYTRIANTPNFRPHGAARPTMYRSFSRSQRSYQPRSYQPRPYQDRLVAAQQHRMYRGAFPPGGGFLPQQPRMTAAGYPAPGWSTPYPQMVQPWGFQIPMFARQFAWRPAEQPWIARNPMPRQAQPQYRVRSVPQTVGFRPTGPAAAPVVGSWRPAVRPVPVVRPQHGYQRYAARPPITPAGREAMFRTAPRDSHPVPGPHFAGLDRAPVQVGPGYWRPQAALPAAAWQQHGHFRPQAYGRRVVEKAQVASAKAQTRFTRDNLPGWVTTYQDSGYEGSCSSCSGS